MEGRTQATASGEQQHRSDKAAGLVRLFVGDTALEPEIKVQAEHWCAEQMLAATGSSDWSEEKYQLLALEHKLVAARGSFLDVYQAMVLLDRDAAAPVGSGENKGPAPAQILSNELAELETCVSSTGMVDEFKITEVLRRHGRLEKMPSESAKRIERADAMLAAISAFAAACNNESSTVRDVLTPVLDANLFEIDQRLASAHADKSPAPAAPGRGEEESHEARLRRGWCMLFASPWIQLKRYRAYLSGYSMLATHQIVKGSEFKHVMVVMDDKVAGGNQFSYDKIFGGTKLSKTDKENEEAGKETTIDRTLRLLYVTCSRARESLALVLWSSDRLAALASIKDSGWFAENEVQEISQMKSSRKITALK